MPSSTHSHSPTQVDEAGIHVWTFETLTFPQVFLRLRRLLSQQELERAARFNTDTLHSAFTISHGVVRQLLALYLHIEPEAICYGHGSHGKPFLALPTPLQFNLAHSGHLATLAVAYGCPVSIDIEEVQDKQHMSGLKAVLNFAPGKPLCGPAWLDGEENWVSEHDAYIVTQKAYLESFLLVGPNPTLSFRCSATRTGTCACSSTLMPPQAAAAADCPRRSPGRAHV